MRNAECNTSNKASLVYQFGNRIVAIARSCRKNSSLTPTFLSVSVTGKRCWCLSKVDLGVSWKSVFLVVDKRSVDDALCDCRRVRWNAKAAVAAANDEYRNQLPLDWRHKRSLRGWDKRGIVGWKKKKKGRVRIKGKRSEKEKRQQHYYTRLTSHGQNHHWIFTCQIQWPHRSHTTTLDKSLHIKGHGHKLCCIL